MRILMIEDDIQICDSLAYQLKQENIDTDIVYNGEEGLTYALSHNYDLILLDRMLPYLDGLMVLEKIRQHHIPTPVIMLTALGSVKNRVEGLDTGADDYLVKPFAFDELMARIRSILRRPVDSHVSNTLIFGNLTYDTSQNTLTQGTLSCTLSKREGDLLEFFFNNPAQILPRDTILSRIWGFDSMVEDGNLDNYIYFLRRRLRQVQGNLKLVTIRGIGYRLEETHD